MIEDSESRATAELAGLLGEFRAAEIERSAAIDDLSAANRRLQAATNRYSRAARMVAAFLRNIDPALVATNE